MKNPAPRDYEGEAWLTLREQILLRDGYTCRNCGVGSEKLEIHHWRPEASHQDLVDELGYALEGDPLIVHPSGLVTLCTECHGTLTQLRGQRVVLRNPKYEAVDQRTGDDRLNIFQLWALNGELLPFHVRKTTWSKKVRQFYRITKIQIGKWPYGAAWGHYVRAGVEGPEEKIKAAGVYDWELELPSVESASASKS